MLFLKCLKWTLSPRLNRLSGTVAVLFCKVCFCGSFLNTDIIFQPNMPSAGDRYVRVCPDPVDLKKLLKRLFRRRAISFL